MICIDNTGVKIPSGVNNVPAIIVYNNNQSNLLEGNEAFEWLNNRLDKSVKVKFPL